MSDTSPSHDTSKRMLIACIGNIFLGDDAFGVEVAQRLMSRKNKKYPECVQVVDFGIRGLELAYSLLELDEADALILVDAVPRGGPPGTLYLIEPSPASIVANSGAEPSGVALDAHSMDPAKVLAFARTLGARPVHTLLVGCEPSIPPGAEGYEEMQMGLSEPVQAAIGEAVKMIDSLVEVFLRSTIAKCEEAK